MTAAVRKKRAVTFVTEGESEELRNEKRTLAEPGTTAVGVDIEVKTALVLLDVLAHHRFLFDPIGENVAKVVTVALAGVVTTKVAASASVAPTNFDAMDDFICSLDFIKYLPTDAGAACKPRAIARIAP